MAKHKPYKLTVLCPKCKGNDWSITNCDEYYEIKCYECGYIDGRVDKVKIQREFVCKDCGSTNAHYYEDKELISIWCKDCKGGTKIWKKHLKPNIELCTYKEIRPSLPKDYKPITSYADDSILHCPKCGSTQVAIGKRGFSLLTGVIGANQTVNRCGKCGHSWKPRE